MSMRFSLKLLIMSH